MNKLQIINLNGQLLVDSREVAEMTDVRHADLMRSISGYIRILENAKLRSQDFFITSTYKVEGNNKTYDCFLLTRKGCDMVANKMTGEKGVLFTAAYVTRFEEMSAKLTEPTDLEMLLLNPDTIIKIAQNWKAEQTLRIAAEQKITEDRPKVLFADAVTASKTTILIGELAKIIKQNGIDMGQNRLFVWLRENGFLISRRGTDYNMPTQRAMDLGLFEIKETSVSHSDGHITISKTPKVTGKGQVYFINKFKEDALV